MMFDLHNFDSYPYQNIKNLPTMTLLDTTSDTMHNIVLIFNLLLSFFGMFFTQKTLLFEIQLVFGSLFALNLCYIFLFSLASFLEEKHDASKMV